MNDAVNTNRYSQVGNLLVIGAMGLFWFTPLIRFWGAVYGPFRPFSYSEVDVSPAIIWIFVGILFCLMPLLLPKAYFCCWERRRGIMTYEFVGIRLFKRYATNGDLINRWARKLDEGYRLVQHRSSAIAWGEKTVNGERGHMILLLFGLFSAIYALYIGWTGWSIILIIGNIVFNLYPILLQRFTRCRIDLFINKKEVC